MLTIIIFIFLIALAISCIKIVPQANAYVIEFLGSYKTIWHNGLHFLIPFLDRVAKRVS